MDIKPDQQIKVVVFWLRLWAPLLRWWARRNEPVPGPCPGCRRYIDDCRFYCAECDLW